MPRGPQYLIRARRLIAARRRAPPQAASYEASMTEDHEQGEDAEGAVSAPFEIEHESEVLAELEADEAETAAHEPADPSEAAATTPEQWESRHKDADARFKTYVRAIAKIYEDDAPSYLQCPLCANAPAGFLSPADRGHIPPDVTEAVLAFLGLTGGESVPSDPYSRACDTCGGWGRCATGSKVPNMETIPCLPCGGLGWIAVGPERAMGAPPIAADNGATEGRFVPAATGPESPEVSALRNLGYTVIPPMQGVS